MGINFEDIKDAYFETKVFFANSFFDLEEKINKFLASDFVMTPAHEHLSAEEQIALKRRRGKIVPINISYDVQVEHTVGGPKNLMHYNEIEHQAILTYRYVECDEDFNDRVNKVKRMLSMKVPEEYILSENYTQNMIDEAKKRMAAE